ATPASPASEAVQATAMIARRIRILQVPSSALRSRAGPPPPVGAVRRRPRGRAARLPARPRGRDSENYRFRLDEATPENDRSQEAAEAAAGYGHHRAASGPEGDGRFEPWPGAVGPAHRSGGTSRSTAARTGAGSWGSVSR